MIVTIITGANVTEDYVAFVKSSKKTCGKSRFQRIFLIFKKEASQQLPDLL